MAFRRKHLQLIAMALENLDAALLAKYGCYFAGGTSLAMMHGEYRESNDMDFMISDMAGYRQLRMLLTGSDGLAALAKSGGVILQLGEPRTDQYGIRGKIQVQAVPIKLEIVFEGRITLEIPTANHTICGITRLTDLDLATEKMLANSDRWGDAAIFSRDLIDLAMMGTDRTLLKSAVQKAELAYGAAIRRDLEKAIDRMLNRTGWIERCIAAMDVSEPRASLMQRIIKLGRDAGLMVRLGTGGH
jgi:hypothetical protein